MSFLLNSNFPKDKEWDSSPGSSPRDWRFAYKMLFNARCIGTPMATPSVRHVSVVYTRASHEAIDLPRSCFIRRRALVLLGRYIALCIHYDPAIFQFTPDGIPFGPADFAPEKRRLLRKLPSCLLEGSCPTTRELLVRFHFVLDRIIPDYLVLSCCHNFLAILFFGSSLDSPAEWPPLFGSLADAFTLRRYWSHFWHHLIYRSFKAWAVNRFGVFAMSAGMHALVDWKLSGGQW